MTDIILLALSILNPDKLDNSYTIEDENAEKDKYKGALEPIIIHRMCTTSESDEIMIVTLCTDDVLNKDISLDGEKITTIDYFKRRVEDLSTEKRFSKPIHIKIIKIDESDPNRGIITTINFIRGIKEIGEFWIDTHGGFRDIVLNMEAVVSLLKVDNIIPDRIYGVRYENNTAILVSQKESFSMFDFVSGMNEFINNGSTRILKRFLEGKSNKELQSVIESMNTISDGIEECNPKKYENGLNNLNAIAKRLENTDSLMGLFAKHIIDSYGILLEKEKRSTIDIIKWCLNYGLLQQALTILDALMPEEIYKRKILFYDINESEIIRSNYNRKYHGLVKPEDVPNYVINDYIKSNTSNRFFKGIDALDGDEIHYLSCIVKEKQSFTNFRTHTTYTLSKKRISINEILRLSSGHEITIFSCIHDPNDQTIAGQLLRLHKALKKCRNKYNHCDTTRLTADKIKQSLELYIKNANGLFDKYPIINA